jgi:hypothetical protein
VFLQLSAEVEEGGFVGNTLEIQPGELPQDGGLVQRFLHRCNRTNSASNVHAASSSTENSAVGVLVFCQNQEVFFRISVVTGLPFLMRVLMSEINSKLPSVAISIPIVQPGVA